MENPVTSATGGDGQIPSGEAAVLNAWWVPLIIGLLNVVAGLVVLIEPHGSLSAIAVVLGIYLVIVGILVASRGLALPAHRWLIAGIGALAVVAGVLIIVRPGVAIEGVRIIFGIYLLFAALVRFGAATLVPENRGEQLIRGALDLIGGVVFLAAPRLGVAALALFLGVYLLLRGCMEIAVALALREARHETVT
jgi:uncharacterized membrane protein HdeD (DUF308 family)